MWHLCKRKRPRLHVKCVLSSLMQSEKDNGRSVPDMIDLPNPVNAVRKRKRKKPSLGCTLSSNLINIFLIHSKLIGVSNGFAAACCNSRAINHAALCLSMEGEEGHKALLSTQRHACSAHVPLHLFIHSCCGCCCFLFFKPWHLLKLIPSAALHLFEHTTAMTL